MPADPLKRYRVRGTIELNWETVVHAENEDEAEELAASLALDGTGLSEPVGEAEVWSVKELPE